MFSLDILIFFLNARFELRDYFGHILIFKTNSETLVVDIQRLIQRLVNFYIITVVFNVFINNFFTFIHVISG